jgi:hypothetical protein
MMRIANAFPFDAIIPKVKMKLPMSELARLYISLIFLS